MYIVQNVIYLKKKKQKTWRIETYIILSLSRLFSTILVVDLMVVDSGWQDFFVFT